MINMFNMFINSKINISHYVKNAFGVNPAW